MFYTSIIDFLEYITRQKGFKSLMLDGSIPIPVIQLQLTSPCRFQLS